MTTPTYDLLDSVTLSSSSSSINFTSIDTTTYRDLTLVVYAEATVANDFYPRLRYNGYSGSGYYWVSMAGTGSATQSYSGTENGQQLANNQRIVAGTASLIIADLIDAGATDKSKNVISRVGQGSNGVEIIAGRAGLNSAITSIELYSANGASLAAGATVYLYGKVA